MKKFFALLCIGALLFSPIFIHEAQATVNATYSPAIYSGGTGGTTFAFSWKIFEATDLVVQVLDSAGAFHNLVLNVDYTCSVTSFPNNGNVILSGGGSWPTIPSGYTLVISRALPYTQLISISDYSPTPASTWNEALDRTAMIEQQLSTRAVLQATSATGAITLPAPVANYLIGWDSSGVNLTNFASTGGGGTLAVPIADSNLQTITTAGKVSGTAITGLASLPAGAGVIPSANLPATSVPLSDIILRGFELVYADTTTVTVNAGSLMNGTTYVNKVANTTLTIGTAGNWYDGATHSYAGGAGWNYIGVDNAGNVKFLFTNAPTKADISGNTAGTLLYYPNGATYYRVIGAVHVATNNTIDQKFYQQGNYVNYDTEISIFSGSTPGVTWTTVSCAAAVPAISQNPVLWVEHDAPSDGSYYGQWRVTGSTGVNHLVSRLGSTPARGGQVRIRTDGSQQFDYNLTGACSNTLSGWIQGYYLNIR